MSDVQDDSDSELDPIFAGAVCKICADVGYVARKFVWPMGMTDYSQIACQCPSGALYRDDDSL